MPTIEQYFLREAARLLKDEFLPKIEQAVATLSEEEVWQRPAPESNSIGNLLLHLSGNIRQHVIAGLGGEDDTRIRHLEFKEVQQPPKEELLKSLRETVEETYSTIENLDPALLPTKRVIQNKEVRVIEDLLHVVEHFSYHTGQIVYRVKTVKQMTFPWYDDLKET